MWPLRSRLRIRRAFPEEGLERELALCANLISADIGIRVLHVKLGGFDTHSSQATNHIEDLTSVDTAIDTFFNTLDPAFSSRTTLMTYSEFGRRPWQNGSAGTDHGTSSVLFVVGSKVNGGLHGTYPSLTDLDSRNNLKHHVDFRSVYATVLDDWLAADSAEIIGRIYEPLSLFSSGPGNSVVVNPPPNPGAPFGYLITTAEGTVSNYGTAASYGGSAAGSVESIRSHPTGSGYWLVTSNGGVEPFGECASYGSMAGTTLASPIVDM